jgi:hypothetical protein
MNVPPLHELTTESGNIFHLSGVTKTPYLNSPLIEVVAKNGYTQSTEREFRFNFRLNESPDEIWQEILGSLLGNFKVEIISHTLRFDCIPANLNSRFGTVQKAVADTNRFYQIQRQTLITKIKEKDKQEAAQAEADKQSQGQVQKLYDELKLKDDSSPES